MRSNQIFKDTEIGKIPEEWEVVRLEDIVTKFISGGTPSTKESSYWNEEIPWITSAYINGFYVSSGEKYISRAGLENSATNIVPKDNILIATRVGIGKVAVNLIDIAISQDLTGALVKKEKVYPNFLCWSFSSPKVQNVLQSFVRGTTIKGIARSELVKIQLPLPPLPEQKKIAEILSTVDKAIEKVDEAIEKTQRLKKGLMQELLTGRRNTVDSRQGKREFKETEIGRIPREWEVVRVGDICKGLVPGRNKPKKFNGDIPWVTLPDIDSTYVNSSKQGLCISIDEIKSCGGKIVPANSVIMNCVGEFGTIAITTTDMVINQQLHAFICPEIINPYFLTIALKSQVNYMRSIATTTVVPYMNKDKCNSIPIPLPTLPEQKKIAEILSTVDKRLELLRKKKEKLERVKKGLMDDLLTGKKRVKLN